MTVLRLSPARLEDLHRALHSHIDARSLPGLAAVFSCHNETHVETLGTLAFDDPAPVQRDTIFRIASLTKPIAAVAVMLLVEDCALRLDDPIDPWLPELADRKVLRSLASPIDDTVPAHRPLTVRDLLTYRMGFGSIMAPPGTYPVQQLIRDYRLGGDGPLLPNDFPPLDEYLRRLGSIPLLAQPGERWMYHNSGEVLGALVARVSGLSFGEFLRQRLFEPLGMKDTAFYIPADKRHRVAGMYSRNQQTSELVLYDDPATGAWSTPPAFESGGGGLVSTLDDYLAFSRMMLNMGNHNGRHILSRATVELMTTDQLTPSDRIGTEIFFGDFASWGLGLGVDIRAREIYHTPGRYGWAGGFGTIAYNDPTRGVIGILFTQRMMESPIPPKVMTDFWTFGYSAIL